MGCFQTRDDDDDKDIETRSWQVFWNSAAAMQRHKQTAKHEHNPLFRAWSQVSQIKLQNTAEHYLLPEADGKGSIKLEIKYDSWSRSWISYRVQFSGDQRSIMAL